MPEERLKVKRGPDLFQQVMDDLPAPTPGFKKTAPKLPLCDQCQHDWGNTQRIARPGGKWACMRGHGILSDR